MPETCESWLGLVKSTIHYTHQIYHVLPYKVEDSD